MQEVGDSLVSIEQDLAAVKSETNDSFSRVSTDIDNTGTCAVHSIPFLRDIEWACSCLIIPISMGSTKVLLTF